MTRRFLIPEAIQTSDMDCGPAALKALLEGHGIRASYGRLREACQTGVDGTSIDVMEVVANQLGLEAEQVMMPLDHVLEAASGALPALIVTRLPDGSTHFVVLWSVVGPFAQVMDPGVGRRWTTKARFLEEVYIHAQRVPAEAWRGWMGSTEGVAVLRRRLAALGIAD